MMTLLHVICGLGPPNQNPGYAYGPGSYLKDYCAMTPPPPFGSPITYKYVRIVRKIEPWPLFGIWAENLGKKTDWIWVKTIFFGLHLNLGRRTGWIWVKIFFWSSSFSSGFISLSKFLATRQASSYQKSCVRHCYGVRVACDAIVIEMIEDRDLKRAM